MKRKNVLHKIFITCIVLLTTLSQSNVFVFAEALQSSDNEVISEESVLKDSENSESESQEQVFDDNGLVEEEQSDLPFTTKVTPVSAGMITFDGQDLSLPNNEVIVQNYDSTKYSKTLQISANFSGDNNVKERQIVVKIENGLGLDTAPGMVATNASKVSWNFDSTTLPEDLRGLIVNGTFTPNAKVEDFTYQPKSGTLVYDIAPGTTSVNLSLALVSDMGFNFSEGHLTLTNPLSVSVMQDGETIEHQILESYQLTGTFLPILYNGGFQTSYTVKAGANVNAYSRIWLQGTNVGVLFASDVMHEEIKYTYKIDKNAGLSEVDFSASSIKPDRIETVIDHTSDPVYDFVTIKLKHADLSSAGIYFVFNIPADAKDGTYPLLFVESRLKLLGNSDYTTVNPNGGVTLTINVNSSTNSDLTIAGLTSNALAYSDAVDEDDMVPLGGFYLKNTTSNTSENQKMQLKFEDTSIGVRAVSIPFEPKGTAKNIVIKTNKGNTYTKAELTGVYRSYNSLNFGKLKLIEFTSDKEEYITEVTYELGDIPSGAQTFDSFQGSISPDHSTYYPAVLYFGKLLEKPVTKSYSAKASIASNDQAFEDATIKATNTMNIVDPHEITINSTTNITNDNPAVKGGETKTIVANFDLSNYKYNLSAPSIWKGYNVYLREGDYLKIDSSSIKVEWEGKQYTEAAGNLKMIKKTDNTGNTVYQLSLDDIKLGVYKENLTTYTGIKVTYDVKVKASAPTTSVPMWQLIQFLPMNGLVLKGAGSTSTVHNPNTFDVDGSGDLKKVMGTIHRDIAFKIQAQKDFNVTTTANLNDGPWVSYDYDTEQTIINLNPKGQAKYRMDVMNNSGQVIEGYTALIPIPKKNEATDLMPTNPADFDSDVHLQKEAFAWTVSLLEELDVSSSSLDYEVSYATTYETDKDSTKFKSWNEIDNKNDIRMIRVSTTSNIPDGTNDSIEFPLTLNDVNTETDFDAINIYAARIHRVIGGNSGYKTSEPVAIRLKTGFVKGMVFDDKNRNGIRDADEAGRNGVIVSAYEAGTTNLVEVTSTSKIDGQDGSYALLSLDMDQPVDIVFTNPNTDDSTRFSPVSENGSTAESAADHLTAKTSNVTPNSVKATNVTAGIITPTTLTFNAGKGSIAEETIKKYPGESIETEPVAIQEGSTFSGWYTASTGGKKVDFPYVAGKSDVTLYARYTLNTYTVNYLVEGANTSATSLFGALLTPPADPTKVGYTFDGWYDESNEKWDFKTNTMPAKDITLTAKFVVNHYDLIFNDEGKTTIKSVQYDTLITEPTAPIKTGYTFVGWYDAETGGNQWNFAVDKMPADTKTLYARYTINSYPVTFDNQGDLTTTSVKFDSLLTEPVTPVKDGYTFNGWREQESGQIWDFATTRVPARSVTLVASFTADDQTITFDVNGGDEASQPADIIAPTHSLVDLDQLVPTKSGYTFIGWYDGSSQVSGTIEMPIGGLHLVAKWTADSQVVSFNTNGGTGVASIVTLTDEVINLDDQVTTREGYTFLGWRDENNQLVAGLYTVKANGMVFTAEWRGNDQTVTFDVNGGDPSKVPADIAGKTGMVLQLDKLTQPERDGFEFLGWEVDGELVANKYVVPSHDVTLKARWKDLIATGIWEIKANDVVIPISEFKAYKENGTLNQEVLTRSQAKAWNNQTGATIEPLSVDVNELMETDDVGIYPIKISYTTKSYDSLDELQRMTTFASQELSTTIKVSIVEDPVIELPSLELPQADNNQPEETKEKNSEKETLPNTGEQQRNYLLLLLGVMLSILSVYYDATKNRSIKKKM